MTPSTPPPSPDNPILRDGWTHDADYRRCYQSDDEVDAILGFLDMDAATALADIGCGNGAFAVTVARRNPLCQVFAFDALDSAVEECKTRAQELTNFHAEVAWAHSIPLPDSSCDRALFRSVLHHIAEPQAAYDEISRLLKPGGRLVLQAPCNTWDEPFGQVLSELMWLDDNSHRRFYYRPEEIVEGLRNAGFSAMAPECWPYAFPFLTDAQARFIQKHKAAKRLLLRRIEDGKWSMEGSWVRVVAERTRRAQERTPA